DGHAAILRNTFTDPYATTLWVWLKVLLADLFKRVDVFFQRRLREFFRKLFFEPALQSIQLCSESLDRLVLLVIVGPIDVERSLDARFEQQRDSGLRTDLRLLPPQKPGRAMNDLASGVSQQVEGVFDATSSLQRSRVHPYAKSLRQLSPIET